MSSDRHSNKRKLVKKQRVVSVSHQICYGLSQKCDFFQKDNGLFLVFCHITDEGLETQRNIGTACSSRVITRSLNIYASQNTAVFDNAVSYALDNEKLILLFIDDYTKVHTKRRPTNDVTSVADNMCTIAIKIFHDIPAIPFPKSVKCIHNPKVVDYQLLSDYFFSSTSLQKFGFSFASTVPELTVHFFDPVMERQRLESHDYQAAAAVRDMRGFHDVYLLDFKKLPLKSKSNYESALSVVLNSSLSNYLTKYIVVLPADWPGQFYPRQLIYSSILSDDNISGQRNLLTSIIPSMGPLHVDLNSDEDIMLNYLPFFRLIYESVFPGKKLADHPKPWRIQFLLEITYGGWTLVRSVIKTVFCNCKDIQYGTLLNLLDNYIPLSLCSYNILFKLGKYKEYFHSIARLWLMFLAFHRHHYDKSTLIWMSNALYWQSENGCVDVFKLFNENLCCIDEYFVEFIHSIIRRNTTSSDSTEQMVKKVFGIFASKERQANFRASFTPAKNYVFSRTEIRCIYAKVASVIVGVVNNIAANQNCAHPLPRVPRQRQDCTFWSMPDLFGKIQMKSYFLPLGFQFSSLPDPLRRCDLKDCLETNQVPWKLFESCRHSFHVACLKGATYCPICRDGVADALSRLSESASASYISQSSVESLPEQDSAVHVSTCCDSDDEDHPVNCNETNIEQMLVSLTQKVIALQPSILSPPVKPPNKPCTDSSTGTTATKPAQERKPPHCTQCRHLKKGHSKKEGKLTCRMCPNSFCSSDGTESQCSCFWHTSRS